MEDIYIEGAIFEKRDFTKEQIAKGEYENCSFMTCNFSNTDLSGIQFAACIFDTCNLSVAKLTGTAFRDIVFKNCKMQGLHVDHCKQFGLSFSIENCLLDHCSFFKTTLKKTSFKNSRLHEVDFTECDLSLSVLDYCDLLNATFDHTILEKADFRNSYNYSIDPDKNSIKKAKFSLEGISGLLDKYDITVEK